MKIHTGRALGFLAAAVLGACGGGAESPGHDHDHDHGTGGHDHAHTAPHGGLLLVLGDTALHVELVHDAERSELAAYVLDAHADKPVRVAQPTLSVSLELDSGPLDLDLAAVASTLTGETVGDTSQFEAASPELAGVRAFSGTLGELEVRGITYAGVPFSYPSGVGEEEAGKEDR